VAPWLIFYATLSVVHFAENTFLSPMTWLPFYSWFRLVGHLYLLMPAPQGATFIYTSYIDPYLTQYETDIEQFISDSHDKLKALGFQYVKQALDWVRVNLLGQQPPPPSPPPPAYQSYAQTLLSRFYSPSAAAKVAVPAPGAPASTEFYNSVLSALSAATSGITGPRTAMRSPDLSSARSLVPPELSTPAERLRYISQARAGLQTLMQMYDREAADAHDDQTSDGLSKSRSETEFDKIEKDEILAQQSLKRDSPVRHPSSGWMPWNWSTKDDGTAHDGTQRAPDVPTDATASGVDLHGH